MKITDLKVKYVKPVVSFEVWDEVLRLVAEAYAARCIWEHNPELEDLSMGENLFIGTGPFDATEAMLNWYDKYLH